MDRMDATASETPMTRNEPPMSGTSASMANSLVDVPVAAITENVKTAYSAVMHAMPMKTAYGSESRLPSRARISGIALMPPVNEKNTTPYNANKPLFHVPSASLERS